MGISIIGAGMGDTKILTREAMEKIEASDLIIGAKRVLEPFLGGDKKVFFEYEAEKILKILSDNEYENAAVLFSGDVSFYSGAKKLIGFLPDAEVIAGISCVSYFCAKTGMSCESMNIVSMHGRKCNIVSEVRTHFRTFVLLGDNPCRELAEYGLGGVTVYIGERLSLADERIRSGRAEDFCDARLDKLSVMVIENTDYDNSVHIGIDDGEFIRGDVPMTKSEVRAVSVSRLNIAEDDICWDVGAGTGSVTVEMARLCRKGTVYAVEKNAAAAELIRQNCRKFMTDNVRVIEADAPQCLAEPDAPDKVFIGGSSGNMRGIIEAAIVKNRNVSVVINVISPETLSQTLDALKDLNMNYEISQICVSRNKTAGTLNIMCGLNPVYVISAGYRERRSS